MQLKFLLLASALLSAACASLPKLSAVPTAASDADVKDHDLLIPEEATFEARIDLTPDEVRRDLDLLLYALRNAYGGRKYVAQMTFSSALSDLQNLKARASEFRSTEVLLDAIDSVLLKIPDNHLHARHQELGFTKARMIAERKASVGANVLKDSSKAWGITHRRLGMDSVPILSITRLPHAEDTAWAGFKDQIEKIAKSAPALVIDLRGNGGGSDVMPNWLASRLAGKPVETPYLAVVKSQTPATLALAANGPHLQALNRKRTGKPVPNYLLDQRKKQLELYESAVQGRLLPEKEETISSEKLEKESVAPFGGPIYILQDAECLSSCESTLEYFEALPNVVTLGENTGGSVHFGNVAPLLLPNSHIHVQIATDFWRYKDGRYLEKIGYTPKVAVAPGEDALDVALNALKKTLIKAREIHMKAGAKSATPKLRPTSR